MRIVLGGWGKRMKKVYTLLLKIWKERKLMLSCQKNLELPLFFERKRKKMSRQKSKSSKKKLLQQSVKKITEVKG